MADKEVKQPQEGKEKFKGVRKLTWRGLQLEELVKLPQDKLQELLRARIKRKFRKGIGHKFTRMIKKIRFSKANVKPGEKPKPVKTHLRTAVVVPEMVGAVVGVYSGRNFSNIEIKFDMIGRYLGEFALSYKPTRHGKPGVGATKGSQHTD